MTEPSASRTADGVALIRAVHQLLDDQPLILDDPVSLLLVGESMAEVIRRHPEKATVPAVAALRSHVVLRSRYAEDRLRQAMQRGVAQYVMLGAGLDTFAYRQPPWAENLHIFEVDHRASQQAKRDQLERAGVAVPSNVAFATLDLNVDLLGLGLVRAGFDPEQPAFISCLGVLAYLNPVAVDSIFVWVASLPRGSEFVFTFAQPTDGPERGTAARVAELDEPWRTRFRPAQLRQRLAEIGYTSVSFLEPADAAAYFGGRSDALRPPARASIVRALI